ncbi:MAG: hypothetical protein AAF604_00160 [Acidobacteriota bacterium]
MGEGWILLAGLLPLAVGPLLAMWFDQRPVARGALDSFVAITLGGLVLLHLWPHAFEAAGWLGVVAGIAGLALPYLFHGILHAGEEKAFAGLIGIAFLGLALHAMIDGAALVERDPAPQGGETVLEGLASDHDEEDHHHLEEASADHHHGDGEPRLLATAVLLHRLPMALAIWWLVVPALGRRLAVLILVTLAAGTILGFSIAGRFLVGLSTPAAAVFEATVGGMLLHVLFGHEHRHEPGEAGSDTAASARRARWISAASALVGVALLVGLTALHPLARRLPEALGAGETFLRMSLVLAPWWLVAAFLAALLSALGVGRPKLEPLLTWVIALPLLGPLLSALAGIVAGLAGAPIGAESEGPSRGQFGSTLRGLVQRDFPWLLTGIGLVAWTEPMLRLDLPWFAQVPLALALGLLGSRSLMLALPLAHLLLLKGWLPPWALLLVLTAVVLSSRFRARALALAIVALALAFWLSLQDWAPTLAVDLTAGRPTAWWAWGGLLAATGLGLDALFRLGFRGFVSPVQGALVGKHRH